MAEKVIPASKTTAMKAAAAAAPSMANVNSPLPASKAQPYNAARPVYRPHPHRSRRSCYCYCCLWIIFIILLSAIICALASGVLYFLYRPHRPSFTISSLRLSQFNLTSSNQLTTRFDFTVVARNPNKKIVFYYDPVPVSIHSQGVDVGDGLIPGFVSAKKSTTTLRTFVRGQSVVENGEFKSDLKKKSLPLKIEMGAKVKVKIGSRTTKRAHVRVVCDGIKAAVPTGESVRMPDAKCKVDLRIKIWKWTI
ncbi:hypothetical protein LXL04_032195 [Taraxacum kok-saghyz]